MHATGEYTIADLMEVFSVGRATVYRTIERQASLPRTARPRNLFLTPSMPGQSLGGVLWSEQKAPPAQFLWPERKVAATPGPTLKERGRGVPHGNGSPLDPMNLASCIALTWNKW